jgi:ribosome maturation factor RimP
MCLGPAPPKQPVGVSEAREFFVTALENIERLIEPTLKAMGFELVLARMHGGSRPRLQIMAEPVDLARGMTVDDCADISHAVSAVLDVNDPIAGTYVLEVSSPGLDRPLVKAEHFSRFQGERAKLETELPIEGRRRFVGRLEGLVDGDVLLTPDEGGDTGSLRVPLAGLRKAKLVPPNVVQASPKPTGRGRKRKGKGNDGA